MNQEKMANGKHILVTCPSLCNGPQEQTKRKGKSGSGCRHVVISRNWKHAALALRGASNNIKQVKADQNQWSRAKHDIMVLAAFSWLLEVKQMCSNCRSREVLGGYEVPCSQVQRRLSGQAHQASLLLVYFFDFRASDAIHPTRSPA